MKEVLNFWSMAMILALCVGFSSCDNDDEPNGGGGSPSGTKRISKMLRTGNAGYYDVTSTYFHYDSQGRVIKTEEIWSTQYGDTIITKDFVYAGNKITETGTEKGAHPTSYYGGYSAITYQLNEKGFIVSGTEEDGYKFEYLYNEQNQLISIRDSYDDGWDYTWMNGNLVMAYSEQITYTNYENKISIFGGGDCEFGSISSCPLEHLGYFGVKTKNLPKSDWSDCDYTYEFDNNGFVTKITESGGFGYSATWLIEYE